MVPIVLQNVFLCVQQKKETQTGLQRKRWPNSPFKPEYVLSRQHYPDELFWFHFIVSLCDCRSLCTMSTAALCCQSEGWGSEGEYMWPMRKKRWERERCGWCAESESRRGWVELSAKHKAEPSVCRPDTGVNVPLYSLQIHTLLLVTCTVAFPPTCIQHIKTWGETGQCVNLRMCLFTGPGLVEMLMTQTKR